MKNYEIYRTNHDGKRTTLIDYFTEGNPLYILINDNTGVVHSTSEWASIPLIIDMYEDDSEPYTLYKRTGKVVRAKIAGDVYGDMTEKALYARKSLYYILTRTFGLICSNPQYKVNREIGKYMLQEYVTFEMEDGDIYKVNVSGDSVTAMVDDCIAAVKARKKERELGMYTGGLYAMMNTCEGIQEALEADPEGLFDEDTIDEAYDALIDVIDALTDITTMLEDGYRG